MWQCNLLGSLDTHECLLAISRLAPTGTITQLFQKIRHSNSRPGSQNCDFWHSTHNKLIHITAIWGLDRALGIKSLKIFETGSVHCTSAPRWLVRFFITLYYLQAQSLRALPRLTTCECWVWPRCWGHISGMEGEDRMVAGTAQGRFVSYLWHRVEWILFTDP